jgi:tRNA modification GTPase
MSPRVLDNGALVLYFPPPNTVTGEDVLELHVHGGTAIVRSVLDAIAVCGKLLPGSDTIIRHAEPGEFTKRAFYNGRLDLTQAEALGEALAAETEQQRRLAVSGADGGLAKRYEEWRTMLLYARGELEALIDFSEDQHFDESPQEFMASISQQVEALKEEIEIHLNNASKGELLRTGISIALLGAPNAGKSSLLNRIVGRDAAIVSAEEGTTRDIVDVSVDLNGWLCRLGDMAGLRANDSDAVGLVEREGIRRARERALQSDVVVVLLSVEADGDGGLDVPVNQEVLGAVHECHHAGKTLVVVLNKIDLITSRVDRADEAAAIQDMHMRVHQALPMVPDGRVCLMSCKDASAPSAASATDASRNRDLDRGGIPAFLNTLTQAFSELTAVSIGREGITASTSSLTPAEAQSYWSASLSVTHRQSQYLTECLHHLDDFLSQAQLGQVSSHPHVHPADEAADDSDSLRPLSPRDYHTDLHDDLVGPKIASWASPPADGTVDIVTAAERLRFAANCLAKITGKGETGDVEDVLGVVFEK